MYIYVKKKHFTSQHSDEIGAIMSTYLCARDLPGIKFKSRIPGGGRKKLGTTVV